MDERSAELDGAVPLQGMLGYLNLSAGKPDPRFQRQLSDAYAFLERRGAAAPWHALAEALRAKLAALRAADSAAFRDAAQADAVLALAFDQVLTAYRTYHTDLLFHLSDRELFRPFFLARVCEAVLAQGPPWGEERRIVAAALKTLNDFVGHRPVAVLETRPRGEPYEHERVRPIPLYLRGAGTSPGRYGELVAQALEVLAATDPGVLADAHFDLDLLDELALDPRAYDQGHPANRRPNYVFGEWDPHHLDNQGRYRRFVVRGVLLDCLLERVQQTKDLPAHELRAEAAAVLAGTILMASGMSGWGPEAHDSTTTLAVLMPRIARYRDAFYAQLLGRTNGTHGERLRQESGAARQPFGSARQHLNATLARHRAGQLQQRHLTVLYADLGYPDASREEAAKIPAASVRLLSELLGRLATGHQLAERGALAEAARVLPDAEALLHRGIDCGAFADPWNVLGFQGLFPLFQSREDSVRDPRIDELVYLVGQIFHLYSRLLSEAAARGEAALVEQLAPRMKGLAEWWDRFATTTVSDVRPLHGGEAAASAEHVAAALARWHARGEATADLGFWREHLEAFRSPKAFALVVDALLRKRDHKAAMALLMNWLGQADTVPLEDGEYSFGTLALQWMLSLTAGEQTADFALVRKFFDYLEANAEDLWQVPELETDAERLGLPREKDDDDDLYGAAYEGMTFQDSTDDGEDSSVAEGGPPDEFDLEAEGERLGARLYFLSAVARLWGVAARAGGGRRQEADEALGSWLAAATENRRKLLTLLDGIHAHAVPEPLGTFESMVEFDRRRAVKEQLLHAAVNTCLDTTLAVGALQGALDATAADNDPPDWQPLAIRIEQALLRADASRVRELLPPFLSLFRLEPLLFTALGDGGDPRLVLRARTAQSILRALTTHLPRLGLLAQTRELLATARAMEQVRQPSGRSISEFNHLFEGAFRGVVEAVVTSAAGWDAAEGGDEPLTELIERLSEPFLHLWVEHSQTLQLSALESVRTDEEWQSLGEFVQRYGHDLFQAKFLTLGNLRGILHRGVGPYLDYLGENPDPLHPVKLIDDLDSAIPKAAAERYLHVILQALVENYEEYKDYNTTTTHSDYGENLYVLLDLLRLKASYERRAWEFRPLALVHEILARQGRGGAALQWETAFAEFTEEPAAEHLDSLRETEEAHGAKLRTVTDRLEERFVKSLAIDRLCALIEPSLNEAGKPGAAAFARLREGVHDLAVTPTGVGLDVPEWLRRIEGEVQRVRASRSAVVTLAETHFQVPRVPVTAEEVRRQFAEQFEDAAEAD